MFHGGTNFGFMAGANYNNNDPPHFNPDTTSYGNNRQESMYFLKFLELFYVSINIFQIMMLHSLRQVITL